MTAAFSFMAISNCQSPHPLPFHFVPANKHRIRLCCVCPGIHRHTVCPTDHSAACGHPDKGRARGVPELPLDVLRNAPKPSSVVGKPTAINLELADTSSEIGNIVAEWRDSYFTNRAFWPDDVNRNRQNDQNGDGKRANELNGGDKWTLHGSAIIIVQSWGILTHIVCHHSNRPFYQQKSMFFAERTAPKSANVARSCANNARHSSKTCCQRVTKQASKVERAILGPPCPARSVRPGSSDRPVEKSAFFC